MKSKLTLQQIALKYPYRKPYDLLNAQHKKIVHVGRLRISLLLSINFMESNPRWHASGAILSPANKPLQLVGVNTEDKETLLDFVLSQLDKVGTGTPITFPPEQTAIHFFKKLTVDQSQKISQKKGHKIMAAENKPESPKIMLLRRR